MYREVCLLRVLTAGQYYLFYAFENFPFQHSLPITILSHIYPKLLDEFLPLGILILPPPPQPVPRPGPDRSLLSINVPNAWSLRHCCVLFCSPFPGMVATIVLFVQVTLLSARLEWMQKK